MKMETMRVAWHWTRTDWFIFALRFSWYGTGLIYYYVEQEQLGQLSYQTFFLFTSLGFFLPLFFWRPHYFHVKHYLLTELVVTGAFSILVNNILGVYLSTSVILMPMLMVGYMMTRDTSKWTIPLFLIAIPLNRIWTMDHSFTFFIQYIDILLFFSIGIGFNRITASQKRFKQLLAANAQQLNKIEQQNKVLQHYANEIERLALTEERNRMASDLHDTIGHHFTSVAIGLDAATFMIDRQPELAKEKLATLSEVARTGLSEIRRTIHQIAPADEESLLTKQLEKLTLDFSTHTETPIDYEWSGTEYEAPPHIKHVFQRYLQECLTNAKRHGEATYIRVSLHFQPDHLSLSIYNNGKAMSSATPGFGLSNMKQRLQEIGGTFEIKQEDGVTIRCQIPIRRDSFGSN